MEHWVVKRQWSRRSGWRLGNFSIFYKAAGSAVRAGAGRIGRGEGGVCVMAHGACAAVVFDEEIVWRES